jgi:hypothetical protein
MKKEKSCWICRRTESEVLRQAKEDKVEDYIGELREVSGMFENNYTKHICPTCDYMIEKIIYGMIDSMIKSDVLKITMDSE